MPQKAGSKKKKSPSSKRVCSNPSCKNYLNENDKHDRCVACLSPRHFQWSQKKSTIHCVILCVPPLIMTIRPGEPVSLSCPGRGVGVGGGATQSHASSMVNAEPSEYGRSGSRFIPWSNSGVRDSTKPFHSRVYPRIQGGLLHPPPRGREGDACGW